MQEQERVANEEAEKRLKAALTAKREPSTTASRVASPALGANGDVVKAEGTAEENAMEVDVSTPQVPEVCQGSFLCVDTFSTIEQSPWLPELSELFEDVKKIVPPVVFDVIGYVVDVVSQPLFADAML